MFGNLVRKTFHGYGAATRYKPEWRVGFLAFKAGVNQVRIGSLTGSGQIYAHEYVGLQPNVQVAYAPGVLSQLGAGQLPGYPPSLAALYGGQAGSGS